MTQTASYDVVLSRARVLDPETGLDGVRDVGVTGDRIAAVSTEPLVGRTTVAAHGLVLAPGFIDLHSHAQSRTGHLLQAMDGVTTALELEMGAASVGQALTAAAEQGRPLNYGWSASWLLTRMRVLDGAPVDDPFPMFADNQHRSGWRDAVAPRDVDRLLDALDAELTQGAIGVGVLVGYAPRTGADEYAAVAGLAARRRQPTFTHSRYMSTLEPGTALDGVQEVVDAAAQTGAHMHLCHLNSSSNRMVDATTAAVERARADGLRVTTEAYPYGTGSTIVGADFLAPDQLPRLGITADRICYLPTGEWVRDDAQLLQLRAEDPGGLVLLRWADERQEDDRALLLRSLLFEDTAVASDAMHVVLPGGGFASDQWPVPAGSLAHPRSTGCFSRTFGWLVRELGAMTLPEAVRRCTLLPAQVLAEAVPAMARKGRVQVGADADLVLFDPETIAEQSTERSVAPSVGVRHLLVGGTFVVRDGVADVNASPGRPLLGQAG